ncbi:MAG: nucleotidyltransferase family protein [Candidatus Cloacimonetes bacterium]|nr:nucleotidyltransferase family protein [Candidatus Cloacimonadota bacterium]
MTELVKIKNIIESWKKYLSDKYNITQIGCFGSFARGEENENSDIDLLVKFSEPIGWEFIELKEFLEKILKRSVDLVTEPALKPSLRETILNEVKFL